MQSKSAIAVVVVVAVVAVVVVVVVAVVVVYQQERIRCTTAARSVIALVATGKWRCSTVAIGTIIRKTPNFKFRSRIFRKCAAMW